MSVKTIRFNKQEESMLKTLLSGYAGDFSGCIKKLIAEKIEDLKDTGVVMRIRESAPSDYLKSGEIDKLFL